MADARGRGDGLEIRRPLVGGPKNGGGGWAVAGHGDIPVAADERPGADELGTLGRKFRPAGRDGRDPAPAGAREVGVLGRDRLRQARRAAGSGGLGGQVRLQGGRGGGRGVHEAGAVPAELLHGRPAGEDAAVRREPALGRRGGGGGGDGGGGGGDGDLPARGQRRRCRGRRTGCGREAQGHGGAEDPGGGPAYKGEDMDEEVELEGQCEAAHDTGWMATFCRIAPSVGGCLRVLPCVAVGAERGREGKLESSHLLAAPIPYT